MSYATRSIRLVTRYALGVTLASSVLARPAHAFSFRKLVHSITGYVTHATNIAATYAAAHRLKGTSTPGMKPRGSVQVRIGSTAATSNRDYKEHVAPNVPSPGDDQARASARASGGSGGLFHVDSDVNVFTAKGDFAIAGAYAKAGRKTRVAGSGKVKVKFDLRGLKLTAAADPGIFTYHYAVSDLDSDVANGNVLSDPLLSTLEGEGVATGTPHTTYYDFLATYNAVTHVFQVSNTSSFMSAGSLLTNADFVEGEFADLDVADNVAYVPGIALRNPDAGVFELDIPTGDISIDEGYTSTATTTPEPASITLMATGLLGLIVVGRRRRGASM